MFFLLCCFCVCKATLLAISLELVEIRYKTEPFCPVLRLGWTFHKNNINKWTLFRGRSQTKHTLHGLTVTVCPASRVLIYHSLHLNEPLWTNTYSYFKITPLPYRLSHASSVVSLIKIRQSVHKHISGNWAGARHLPFCCLGKRTCAERDSWWGDSIITAGKT